MKKVYIGQDNGVSSTIGILIEGEDSVFIKTPTFNCQDYTKAKKSITRLNPTEYLELLQKFTDSKKYKVFICIERPMINPLRFAASISAARCHEAMLSIVEVLGLPYQFIDSKEWQKSLLPEGCAKEELKKMSLQIGNRLFPQFTEFNHPDRDSLLIAEYCRRKNF